jgi:hypothetical protein
MKKPFFHTLLIFIPLLTGFFLFVHSSSLSAQAVPRTSACFSGTSFRLIQARFNADYWMAFRNEDAEELQSALDRANREGGVPEWMKEYGRRLLDSCGRNAILFTGTAFDTIGAWYCQFVEKYRKDVVVLPMGMLDRMWLVDAMDHWTEFLESRDRRCGDSPDMDLPDWENSYAKSNINAFLMILRRRNANRPAYLSMDLNPGFLKAVQDRLSLSGCAFRLRSAPIQPEEGRIDLTPTNRLFSDASRFEAIRKQARPAIPEVDSIRSHYRFAAVQLKNALRTGGKDTKKDRLSEWIRDAFTNAMIPAPEDGEPAGIHESTGLKGN